MTLMLRRIGFTLFLLAAGGFRLYASVDSVEEAEFDRLFPRAGLEDRVEFWKLVFTRYGENDVILHDANRVGLIYKVLNSPPASTKAEKRLRQRQLRAEKDSLARTFEGLIALGPESASLDSRHRELLAALRLAGVQPTSRNLRHLKGNIHTQRGIKERFREGLIRSGHYLEQMQQVFEDRGLPPELVFLPHVESSFNYDAYSHKGAAGVWQITRGAGRGLLKIGRSVDERLDPPKAAKAAAHLLEDNHRALGAWPLALTAYNHGKYGMLRAKRLHGDDIREIIEKYESRIYGYAGQNFYAEFLAAVDIARDPERYFPGTRIDSPLNFTTIHVRKSTPIRQLAKQHGIGTGTLKEYNPQFTAYFWKRSRHVPAGVSVRIPSSASLPGEVADSEPTPPAELEAASSPVHYTVRRGDTLTRIAGKFEVEVEELREVNGIKGSTIWLGQSLLIPSGSDNGGAKASPYSPPSTQNPAVQVAETGRPAPRDSEQVQRPTRYRVRRGDTLITIAGRFQVGVDALKEINGIKGSTIRLGQSLLIPSAQGSARAGIRTRASGSQAVRASNRGSAASVQSADAGATRYKVRRGDTLIKIARRFQVEVDQLMEVNGIESPKIYLGQLLLIP